MTARPAGLDALRREVDRDFARLNHPPANWPAPVPDPDGRPALDVLVAGGGQFGQTAAFALLREGVRTLRVVDRGARGEEGPWATTARMKTLRSPKHLTGPDLGIPSLTFRAWYEAQHGADGWEALYKIDRRTWVDYLLWLRDATGVTVENGVALTALDPADGLLRADLRHADGTAETVFARQVVLASGRDGFGGARLPRFPSFDGRRTDRIVHTGDPVAFERFRGGRVAVLGANASAFDNAASALEAGAAATMWSRRPHLPQVNFTRGMVFSGFLNGFVHLPDATRWALMTRMVDEAAPPPHESVLRCERHSGFSLRFGQGWHDLRALDGGVEVTSDAGPERFDAAILGTGYTVDLARQPVLARVADAALLWRDRVPPGQADRYPELAQHPYLDEGFALVERDPGACPETTRVRLFGPAAAVSHGALAGDIPGVGPGAARLARQITLALFGEDAAHHAGRLFDFEEPELRSTSYYLHPDERQRRR